ncbi:DUF1552 domain-containing protein [Sorangium sp. So ce302]|uniref:DUF1552 domain-containing protein n=1 Tax=Sorangium sp. So ce302 TaxID=3133297 RepID=UPI003F5EA350
MSHDKQMNRRLFLRGAGGAMLALPLLPSLFVSSKALAAVPPPKVFVHMRTGHGGVTLANMYPADATLTQTLTYTHPVRRGALAAKVNGATASLSPVLSAPSSMLTPSLVAKMNVLRGLDIPTMMAHNFGGALGYYDDDKGVPSKPRATIDQIMAYSPAFYPDLSSVRKRSVIIEGSNSGSHGYNTPGDPTSGVDTNAIGGTESAQGLFDSLLAGISSGPATRPPLVDRLLESYKRLRNSNKRLSQEDKLRLDQHIDKVAELQRRLGTSLPAGCTVPTRPSTNNLSLRPMDGDPAKNVQFFQMLNDVLAVAANCGVTRIITLAIDENNQGLTFTNRAAQGEDWHNNVAHAAHTDPAMQELVKQSHQVFFQGVYLDLVSKLNSYGDGQGGTLLDHSLVAWGQESGNITHYAFSMPVVTAGGAGGKIKTGSYCDYRNLTMHLGNPSSSTEDDKLWPGLTYNQWLGTALQAMDIPPSEWATETDHPGYGARVTYTSQYAYFFTNKGFTADEAYSDAVWEKSAEILPFLG